MPWVGGKVTRALEVGQVKDKVSRTMFSNQTRCTGLLALAGALACAPPPRVGSGSPRRPTQQTSVPGIAEPATAYRDMGFFAGGRPVPFVGSIDFFAGTGTDSTLALLSVSLANNALSFQRAGALFQGLYRVEAVFK